MGKMTETQAIDKAIKIWKYMAKTGASSKFDAYTDLGLKDDLHDCPLCEFTKTVICCREFKVCSKCPVWGRSFIEYCYDGGCEGYSDSPWLKWINSLDDKDVPGMKAAAREMVEILQEAKKGTWK